MIYSPENILNFIILVMLFVMIIYCIILNRRLKAFRNIKQEMNVIINQLNASTSHAQKSIIELKDVVFEEGQKLDQKLRKASEMADELDMINETGSNLADRIEQGLTGNKKTQNINSSQGDATSSAEKSDISNEKVSLSGLENEESNAGGDDSMLENLRNVR